MFISIYFLLTFAKGAMWELPLPEPVLREALPSPEVLAERLALIKMIVNLSVTSDEEKYTDVLESVQRWEYAD